MSQNSSQMSTLEILAAKFNWGPQELRHAKESVDSDYKNECVIPLANGRALHTHAHPSECDYVRIVQEGHELAYWSSDEWAEDPAIVMGAIMGCAHGPIAALPVLGDTPDKTLCALTPQGSHAMPVDTSSSKLTHKGVFHSRTLMVNRFADTIREKVLSDKWEEENPPPGRFGAQPILHALFPDCTQRDAQVAATVVQWLGSQVGFHFLQETLAAVGYQIILPQESKTRQRCVVAEQGLCDLLGESSVPRVPYAWEINQNGRKFLLSAQEFTRSSYDTGSFKPLFE